MSSYQDIDVRLSVVEDKLDLLMKMASITKREPSTLMPGEFVTTRMSLLDLYREIRREGIDVLEAVKETDSGNQ
jgi:hypothetical protein